MPRAEEIAKAMAEMDRFNQQPKATVIEERYEKRVASVGGSYGGLAELMSQGRPGNWASDHKAEAEKYAGWHYVAISAIGKAIRSCDVEAYQEPQRNYSKAYNAEDDDSTPLPKWHPLMKILKRPSASQSGASFREEVAIQLCLTGSALIWNVPNQMGRTVERYVIPTAIAEPRQPERGMPKGGWYINPEVARWQIENGWFLYTGLAQAIGKVIDARDVQVIRFIHPTFKDEGQSPVSAGALWTDTSEKIDVSRHAHLRNGSDPSVIIGIDGVEDESTLQRMSAKFNEKYAGPSKHGKAMFVNGQNVKVEPVTRTPAEMAYEGAFAQFRDAIMALHGVTPIAAGIEAPSGDDGLYAPLKQFIQGTVQPILDLMAEEDTEQLATQFGEGLTIFYTAKAIDDAKLTEQQINTDIAAGAIEVDEIRKLRGRKPWGGEKGKAVAGQGPKQEGPGGLPGLNQGVPGLDAPKPPVGPQASAPGQSAQPAKTPEQIAEEAVAKALAAFEDRISGLLKSGDNCGTGAGGFQEGNTCGQRRAKKGGQVGMNGEFYAGGQFLPSTDMPKRVRSDMQRIASGKSKIDEGQFEKLEPGEFAPYEMIGTFLVMDGRNSEGKLQVKQNNDTALAYLGLGPVEVGQLQNIANRFNTGERRLSIFDYPALVSAKDIIRALNANFPIPESMLPRLQGNLAKYVTRNGEASERKKSGSDCGANGPGGGGFQAGNDCGGKRGGKKPKASQESTGPKIEVFERGAGKFEFAPNGELIRGKLGDIPLTEGDPGLLSKLTKKTKAGIESAVTDPDILEDMAAGGISSINVEATNYRTKKTGIKSTWIAAFSNGALSIHPKTVETIEASTIPERREGGLKRVISHEAGHGIWGVGRDADKKAFAEALKKNPAVTDYVSRVVNVSGDPNSFSDTGSRLVTESFAEIHAIRRYNREMYDSLPEDIRNPVESMREHGLKVNSMRGKWRERIQANQGKSFSKAAEGCGANAPGGGGFQPGNDCGGKRGGGSGTEDNDLVSSLMDSLPESFKGRIEPPRVKVDPSRSGPGASYQMFTIFIDPDNDPITLENYFVHEYAHHIDRFAFDNAKSPSDGNNVTDSEEFISVFESTKKRAESLDDSSLGELKKKIKKGAGGRIAIQNLDMVINAALGGEKDVYGHGKDYFSKKGNDRKEVFAAGMSAVHFGQSVVRNTFPELWDYLDARYSGDSDWIEKKKSLSKSAEGCGANAQGGGGFQPGNTCGKRDGSAGESQGGGAPKVNAKVLAWAKEKFGDDKVAENFARWFGDSKVVDEDGNPLRVFHGTNNDFAEFSTEKIGLKGTHAGSGFYATTSPESANWFAQGDKGNIKPLYMSIKNPFDASKLFDQREIDSIFSNATDEQREYYNSKRIGNKPIEGLYVLRMLKGGQSGRFDSSDVLRKSGYDGITHFAANESSSIGLGDEGFGRVFIAFSPTQIKSATGNSGTFDPDNPNITKSAPSGGYRPPVSAQSNARKVLRWKREHGDAVQGMTATGWARARQLASGKKVSRETVGRMAAFARHRKNSKVNPKFRAEPWRDAGYVAWLGWGGDSGINWAAGIVAGEGKSGSDCGANQPGGGGFRAGNTCGKEDGGSGESGSSKVRKWAEKKFKDKQTAENFVKWFGDSKVVDENGEPKVLYHGTTGDFTEFDPRASVKSGTEFGNGIYLTTDPERAALYANEDGGSVKPLYVKAGNPLDRDGQLTEAQAGAISKVLSEDILPEDLSYHTSSREKKVFANKDEARAFYEAQRQEWERSGEGVSRYKPSVSRADQTGKDSVFTVEYSNKEKVSIMRGGRDAISQLMKTYGNDYTFALSRAGIDAVKVGDIYVVTSPNQIKSATGNSGAFSPDSRDITKSSGCGANAQGGGGFQPGNTCAREDGAEGGAGESKPVNREKRASLVLSADERKEIADQGLYLHGTEADFDEFKQGGHKAVYFSDPKEYSNRTTQAEHIGEYRGHLLAVKLDDSKLKYFDPYNDTKAHDILKQVTGKDSKQIDYTDMPEIVAEAEKFGYNKFRVYEPAVQGFSIAITEPSAAKIVKHLVKAGDSERSKSGSSCGANAEGGGGFQPGNTCGREDGAESGGEGADKKVSRQQKQKENRIRERLYLEAELMRATGWTAEELATKTESLNSAKEIDSWMRDELAKLQTGKFAEARAEAKPYLDKLRAKVVEVYEKDMDKINALNAEFKAEADKHDKLNQKHVDLYLAHLNMRDSMGSSERELAEFSRLGKEMDAARKEAEAQGVVARKLWEKKNKIPDKTREKVAAILRKESAKMAEEISPAFAEQFKLTEKDISEFVKRDYSLVVAGNSTEADKKIRQKSLAFMATAANPEFHNLALKSAIHYQDGVRANAKNGILTEKLGKLLDSGVPAKEAIFQSRVPSHSTFAPGDEVRVYVHEMGHQLEFGSMEAAEYAGDFLRRRTSGDELVSFADRFGAHYRQDERGSDDEFGKAIQSVFASTYGKTGSDMLANYTGKIYSDGSTEVLSVGLELFHENPKAFAEADPEWFDLVTGVLTGRVLRQTKQEVKAKYQ